MPSTPSTTRYWREHIEQWRLSGLSQKAYCKQHDLKPSNLSYWKTKYTAEQAPKAGGGFIPVSLESTPTMHPQGLSVHLSSGHRIEGFSSVEDLAVLVRELS